MPKRKLQNSSENAIEAIKLAQQRGIAISEEEAHRFRRSVSPMSVPNLPFGAILKPGKNGEPRYWLN